MQRSMMSRTAKGLGVGLAVALLLGGCAGITSSSGGSASPSSSKDTTRPAPAPSQSPTASAKPVSGEQAERLKRVMVPLLRAMNRPLDPSKVKVGIMDDTHINAASAGGGEFYVTRGLLEKANDQHLAGVLAHELAHDDLNHVAKAQTLGTGISIGAVILDQIFPGAGAIAPIAGKLVINKYTQREEYAADQHGAEILQKAGLPGRDVMADTLTWLMQTEGGSSGGFFATHPATTDRIEALKRMK
jgi:Zn-dependent protease with chaperone function